MVCGNRREISIYHKIGKYHLQIHQARQFPVKPGKTVHSNVTVFAINAGGRYAMLWGFSSKRYFLTDLWPTDMSIMQALSFS